MEWDRREDGDLQLAIVRGFEIAVADSEALAVRIEFAEVQEQLSGTMAPSSKQLVMTPAMAEALGSMLLEQARMTRPPEGQA